MHRPSDGSADDENRAGRAMSPETSATPSDAHHDEKTDSLDSQFPDLTLAHRLCVVLVVTICAAGATWSDAILGPLKSTLVKELHINNAQFGAMTAGVQLVNTVLPIVSGLWMDRYGGSPAAVASTLLVFIGSIVEAAAVSRRSYSILVGGQIVRGLGLLTVNTACAKIIITYTRKTGWMAFSIAMNFALESAITIAAKTTAVRIMKEHDSVAWTFWTSTIVCGSAFIVTTAFFLTETRLGLRRSASAKVSVKSLLPSQIWGQLASLPSLFIIIAATQFYQAPAVFNNLSADIIRRKDQTTEVASYLSSVNQVMPIVLTPIVGFVIDRFGKTMHFVPLTGICYSVSFSLLAFTSVNALCPMILASFGQALNTAPYLAMIPLLVRDSTVGFAWGLWKSLAATDQVIMDTSLGQVQDETPQQTYTIVLSILLATKCLLLLLGLIYITLDTAFAGSVLSRGSVHRKAVLATMAQDHASGTPLRRKLFLLKPHRTSSLWGAVQFGGQIVVAWVLFFVYLL
ncbi:unnamed protein product [Parajaminaea phylloscopi]